MLGAYFLCKRYNQPKAAKFHWVFFVVTVVACIAAYRWYRCCITLYPSTEWSQMLGMASYLISGIVLYFVVLRLPEKIQKYLKPFLMAAVVVCAVVGAVVTFKEYRDLTIPRACPGGQLWTVYSDGPPTDFERLFKVQQVGCIPSEDQL